MAWKRKPSKVDLMPDGGETLEEFEARELGPQEIAPEVTPAKAATLIDTEEITLSPSYLVNYRTDRTDFVQSVARELLNTVISARPGIKVNEALIEEVVRGARILADKLEIT